MSTQPGASSGLFVPTCKADWERFRQPITALYKNHTVLVVMREMKRKHNFDASEDKYKKQFRRWRQDKEEPLPTKRVPALVYRAVVAMRRRIEADNPGRQCQFLFHDQRIDLDKAARFERTEIRKGRLLPGDNLSEVAVPEGLRCQYLDEVPRSPSLDSSDWLHQYVISSESVEQNGSIISKILPEARRHAGSWFADPRTFELFLGRELENDFYLDFLREITTTGLITTYEYQGRYEVLAQRAYDETGCCVACPVLVFEDLVMDCNFIGLSTGLGPKIILGAFVWDLVGKLRLTADDVADSALDVIRVLSQVYFNFGVWDIASSLRMLLALAHKRLAMEDGKQKLAESETTNDLIDLAFFLVTDGEFEVASQILGIKELWEFHRMDGAISGLPSMPQIETIRTRPAEYRDTMSLVVRRVEAGTGVLSQWLTYKDESCARFKYTWARYQLQRRGSLGYEN